MENTMARDVRGIDTREENYVKNDQEQGHLLVG